MYYTHNNIISYICLCVFDAVLRWG